MPRTCTARIDWLRKIADHSTASAGWPTCSIDMIADRHLALGEHDQPVGDVPVSTVRITM